MLNLLCHRTAKGCNFLRQVGTLGRRWIHSLFILASLDGIFFSPALAPSLHFWIIRRWMSFRKWKLKSESQKKSESGRRILREREQRQERQREKKGKVEKRQGNRRKHGRPQRAWARMEKLFCMGFSSWETPEIRDRVWKESLPRKLFCDMKFLQGSISKWNYSTWSSFIIQWPKAGHIHFLRARISSKNWMMMHPNTHYLGVPSSHSASHNPFYFLFLTSYLDCECPIDRVYIMLPSPYVSSLHKAKKYLSAI